MVGVFKKKKFFLLFNLLGQWRISSHLQMRPGQVLTYNCDLFVGGDRDTHAVEK